MKIGEILIEKKVLKADQVQQILAHSLTTNLSFGDAATELGILSREQLVRSLGPSYSGDWFELNANFLPKETQNLFMPADMIRLGVLPLGSKKGNGWFGGGTRLNLGLINPENKKLREEIEARVPKEFKKTKIYLIPADRFIDTLNQVYGIDRNYLRKLKPAEINPMVSLFLEV